MTVTLINSSAGLSDYLAEILRTWGLGFVQRCEAAKIDALDPVQAPVLIAPAYLAGYALALATYAQRGGTVIVIQPDEELARSAGLTLVGELAMPRRLRLSSFLPGGFGGEAPPIVGIALAYQADDSVRTRAYLFAPDQYEGETPGITMTARGQGRIICLAFDLPRCVLLLRQGDPALAEQIPPGSGCWRPSSMAARTGLHDAGWIPYADLLARLLVELVVANSDWPMPLLDQLPHGAPGLALYSGDEDIAPIKAVEEEFDWLTANGARMDLYMIPNLTNSTPQDVERYRRHHDVSPHPNLRDLDGRPMAERLAELERQIRLFKETFGGRALTVRNHCTAWCGYMEHVEVLERNGVRMDCSYFSGSYKIKRDAAPYNGFGSAIPMRFCRPDGRLLDVFQQHTHLNDDVYFAPDEGPWRVTTYSYRFSLAVFEALLERMCRDITERFHMPLAMNFHPGNWVEFSRPQGESCVRVAQRHGFPVWSFTQWCEFWMRRDGWQLEELTWRDGRLTFVARGGEPDPALRVALPAVFQRRQIQTVTVGGGRVETKSARRYGQETVFVPLAEKSPQRIEAVYQ